MALKAERFTEADVARVHPLFALGKIAISFVPIVDDVPKRRLLASRTVARALLFRFVDSEEKFRDGMPLRVVRWELGHAGQHPVIVALGHIPTLADCATSVWLHGFGER